MKRKSLLIMLLVALFVPLAMNAQTRNLKKKVSRAPRPELQLEVAGQLQTIENFQPGVVYNRAAVNNRDNVLYSNGFETSADLSDLGVYDYNQDDFTWGRYSGIGVDDSYALGNQSYDFDNQTAITPDDFIIMPAITLPAGGQYFAGIYAEAYKADQWYTSETMGIFVAPEGDDYYYQVGSDFTLSTGSYEFCEVDLSAYAGQTIEIYIRHYNCSDGSYLFVDNFSVYEKTASPCNSVTFSDLYSATTNLNGVNIPIGDNSSVTFAKGSGNNNPTYYANGTAVRAYAKNTFTVTSTSNIESINITFGSGGNNNTITANTGTYSNGAWTGSATSVTFTVGGTSGNRRIAAIEVCVEVDHTCDAPTGLGAEVTETSAELSWTGNADNYNIQYRIVDPNAPATVILTAADVWGDGSGYQMLLDADATMYGNVYNSGYLISDYSDFEYSIPVGAQFDPDDSHIVVNGSVSIQIPAGTYDYNIFNPTPGDEVYMAGDYGNVDGMADDFVFEAGKTYEFVLSRFGNYDGVNLTITDNGVWTSVPGTVTSPYTLTGLDPETTYEWQVKGDGCDDWSAIASFTTLEYSGILVESITASDVTVLVGETATITPTVLPADATNPAVTFSSSDETVATVDENGNVTGVAAGNTTITIAATDGSGVSTTITVTVNGIDVTGITAENVTVVTGETATISYTVSPTNATDQSVTFTSANTAIATVDADGVVTGVSVGETTITIASVSNPEVTATINVTVTSNPNAVQFTVNAPAYAQPGDVITVEAVLTAPTSGTYGGFNGLILDLEFDNTAVAYVNNSMVYGTVAQAAQQLNGFLYPGTSDNAVQLAISVFNEGSFVAAEGVVFSAQFTVLEGAEGSFEFTAKPNTPDNFDHEGTSILYEVIPSTVEVGVPEQHERDILAWTDKGGFYLIATPIGEVAPTAVTNMIPETLANYDLYYFDQATDGNNNEWINYKGDPTNPMGNFSLVPGKGYLYANKNDVTLIFTGSCPFTEDTYTITLTKDESSPSFAGWNLVGNPFAQTAWVDTDHNAYYTMNGAGTAFIGVTSNSVEAMEGIFVRANSDEEEISFTTIDPNAKCSSLALNLSQGNGLMDRATVRFDEGCQLPKLQFNRNSSKVYIPMDSEDYAVVRGEEIGEMPINFKAESNGTYNLSLSTDNVEFAYLHLIDNLTGNDVDLLQTPSYSFEAKTTDYESRFKLVFATGNNGNDDNFAFFSNGSFVINNEGEATLQVIDVTGRVLKSETINGCANVGVNGAAGVYMLRLINGDNMKVQKVVVK